MKSEQERWILKIKEHERNIELLKKAPIKFHYSMLMLFERLQKEIRRL